MPRIDHLVPAWIDDPLHSLRPVSPRLLLDDDARARIAAARAHPIGAGLWSALVARGERHLNEPAGDGRDGVAGSRTTLDRIYTLGLLAQVTGEARWGERAVAEAMTLTGPADWAGPGEWLVRAERMHAVAIALDWCGPWLGDRRRPLLDALLARGLDAADQAYACRAWWWRDTANWNGVCNGGVLIACLAAADERPAQCRRLIGHALAGLPLHLGRLAPDGGHDEGPGYWAYTWRFASTALGCLRTALGHDFGLAEVPWLDGTAAFRIHHEGPSGRFFAWADSYRDAPFDPNLLWLARRTGRPEIAAAALRAAPRADASPFFGAIARALIDWNDGAHAPPMPLSARFRGPEVALVRTAWTADATWVGLKGGDVQAPHAHRDLGAVVVESHGVRWIDDPGAGDYGAAGYWNGRPDTDGARWNIFACAAEGHSTVLVDGRGCDLLAQMHLVPGDGHAVHSETAFADRGVTAWTRRLARVDHAIVEIHDELICTRPVEVAVQWLTALPVQAVERTAILAGGAVDGVLDGPGTAVVADVEGGAWRRIRFTAVLPAGAHRLSSTLRVVRRPALGG